ncbi:DnaJ-domain-containing protein [Neolentinus lepideus HHB14362 ss-1]|uniref:DnaJ-domain-containing protein n=1 Tax=Neolentinus lepideus HHB14362 ss-1 TaxID=1314782 RepID=A0A165VTE2_9AGAM|nr:DnaJ-domain-containing protein [Neolentinus lepideus HHB14362 ss-1]
MSRVRNFASSSRRSTHYRTLDIPHNATKSQIKTSFYKMSKLHHPDVSDDSSSKAKFQAASEAYSILGDDRKRRAYDRELAAGASSARRTSGGPTASHYPYSQAAYEGRRRGATYAWERHHRPQSASHHPPPGYRGYDPGRSGYSHTQTQHNSHAQAQYPHNPFASPYVRRATGTKKEDWQTAEDRVRSVSGFWRFIQVLGVVLTVTTVGGGFTANAT